MSSDRANSNWLANITPALTLLAPALYVIGVVYHESFLEGFALSAGDFPKTTQEYFVLAYYCLLLQAANAFKWIVYVLLAWIVVCIPYVVIDYQWSKAEDKLVDAQSARLRGRINKEYLLAAIENWERVFKFVVAIFLLVIILSVSALFASQAGQQVAEQQQKNFQGCDQAANKTAGCIFLRDNNVLIASGLSIARSSTHVALFSNGKTTIYPLKDYIVDSYQKMPGVNPPPATAPQALPPAP
jgi:hypothetical protein